MIAACTHPEAPRGLCCHVREKNQLLRLMVVTGSEFV